IRPAAPEIVDRRGDCAFLIAVIGQRAVALFDRIGAPGDEKYRRVVEVLRQLFRIERCRRDDHLEIGRSEEHTSELQSLMRISYAVFCLKKKKKIKNNKK